MKIHRILFCLLFVLPILFLGACGDDDDDDNDDGDDDDEDEAPEDIITAIVEEMVEGQMERTAQALEDKYFPHVSDNYEHAGFDKDDLLEDALKDIEDNPGMRMDSWDLSVDVDLDSEGTNATVSITNELAATMEADEDIDFDAAITTTSQSKSFFVLENDGEWRVVGDEAMFNVWNIAGGQQSLLSDLSDVSVSVTETSAGGSFQITGDAQLPALDEDISIFVGVTLDWRDKRNNAVHWWDDGEVIFFENIDDFLGGAYTFDFVMPEDGDPAGMAIPASLPLGADSIEAQVVVIVQDNAVDGGMIRFDSRNFNIPYKPLSNQEACSPGASAGGDGLWALTLESDDWEMLNLLEIADLRLVGNDVYGAVVYAQESDIIGWETPSLELIGELDGQNINFGFEAEEISIQYTATLAGTEMTDGQFILELTEGEDVFQLDAQFTGKKIDNRCDGVTPEDIDGQTLLVSIGDETMAYSFADNEGEVQMSSTFADLSGVMVRNGAVLLDDEIDGRWLMLGFYDDMGGYAALMEGDTLSEGSFSFQ
jgi:hypothetical protein